MKKLLLLIWAVAATIAVSAQSKEAEDKTRKAENLKTGNGFEVFNSFMKLAASDLGGENRSFSFRSSVFALLAKTDSSQWIDTNYLKRNVSRNLNIALSVGLDSNRHLQNTSLSLTYALVNKRDLSSHIFVFAKEDEWVMVKRKCLMVASEAEKAELNQFFSDVSQFKLSRSAIRLLDSVINKSSFAGLSTNDFRKWRHVNYNTAANHVSQAPLWTVDGKVATLGRSPEIRHFSLGSTYLQGLGYSSKNLASEYEIKTRFDYAADTVVKPPAAYKSIVSLTAGINFVLAAGNSGQPVAELKTTVLWSHTFSALAAGAARETFAFGALLRFKVSEALWIPIELKYLPDTKKFNLSLNLTTNFQSLKQVLKFVNPT